MLWLVLPTSKSFNISSDIEELLLLLLTGGVIDPVFLRPITFLEELLDIFEERLKIGESKEPLEIASGSSSVLSL